MLLESFSFSLYQPEIFDLFRDGRTLTNGGHVSGRKFFATCIALVYEQVGGTHACSAMISPNRLEEARLHWIRDTDRIDIKGDTTPDHFKQAGFLGYWLRRRQVCAEIHRRDNERAHEDRQNRFLICGNEIAAFMVAFRLCAYFEYKDQIDGSENLEEVFKGLHLSHDLVTDISVLMKNKNVSPHALYVSLRALFFDMAAPPRRRTAQLRTIG